jgi:hypothetical protein
MSWSAITFGKYKGKTLPKIILIDVDWFFWALPKLYGKIAEEAHDLARKARAIKIPSPNRKKFAVEYRYERGDRFCGFTFVKASSAQYSRWSTRLPHLDLSRCLRRKYDKRGGRILLRDFRFHYFGESKRLTKKRCERFFSDRRNFIGV